MLHHSYLRVGEDISLQHFIAPSFEFLLCLSVFLLLYSRFGWMFDSPRRSRGLAIRPTNKGIKFSLQSINNLLKGLSRFGGIYQVKTLFNLLWLLMYKRAELDLRSTEVIVSLCYCIELWYTCPDIKDLP